MLYDFFFGNWIVSSSNDGYWSLAPLPPMAWVLLFAYLFSDRLDYFSLFHLLLSKPLMFPQDGATLSMPIVILG